MKSGVEELHCYTDHTSAWCRVFVELALLSENLLGPQKAWCSQVWQKHTPFLSLHVHQVVPVAYVQPSSVCRETLLLLRIIVVAKENLTCQ